MAGAIISGTMERDTMVNGGTVTVTGMESNSIRMETASKVNFLKTRKKVLEYTDGSMVEDMKATGTIASNMALVSSMVKRTNSSKASGKMENESHGMMKRR